MSCPIYSNVSLQNIKSSNSHCLIDLLDEINPVLWNKCKTGFEFYKQP